MRKILQILIVLSITYPIWALEMSTGAEIGIVSSNAQFVDVSVNSTSKTGIDFTVWASMPVPQIFKNTYINAGISYIQMGYENSYTLYEGLPYEQAVTTKTHLDYIQIPILIGYRFENLVSNFYLQPNIGFYLGFATNREKENIYPDSTATSDLSNEVNGFDSGMIINVRFGNTHWVKNTDIFFTLGFLHGLTPFDNSDTYNAYNYAIRIHIGATYKIL